ncbi:hypothetical protein HanHA89_Chr02g0052091 [Helianthus annuus]|nr:hypothetical protein HanHA89_Chr02g0052091 [Helianthus annuus]
MRTFSLQDHPLYRIVSFHLSLHAIPKDNSLLMEWFLKDHVLQVFLVKQVSLMMVMVEE